jgi:hypothetical protein
MIRSFLLSCLLVTSIGAEAGSDPAAAPPATRQYTFAWKFVEGDAMAPRGGTTRGSQVTLAKDPGAEWKRLREPGLDPFERDRRAILALAGEYRTSFDFIEVAGFTGTYAPTRPYQSWGTEKVYVVRDEPRSISLQHVLVMKIVGEDGKVVGPFVTKHWRQDWSYEPAKRLVYRGRNRWESVPVTADEARGAWVQSVWQVDDSPRYSGVGRWQHFGNYSTWMGGEGWRPLPRREYSVRDDYHVLVGTNRHTITPTGWIQEEQNLKVVLAADGSVAADTPVLGREFGLNRYERIVDFDWSPGDRYVERTAMLWRAVQSEWDALAGNGGFRLRAAPDKEQLFKPLFEYADALEKGEAKDEAEVREFAHKAVADYLAGPDDKPADARY